jgi:mannosyltransferase
MTRRTALWVLLAIVLVGTGLRTYELTMRSLWFDEAFSWRLIQFPYAEMLQRTAADVHPPLYYLLLKTWRVVFASSLLSLRMFSVVFAAFTIGAGYLFTATAARSRQAGLLAAALLAFSGFQIQYAWEARMYTLGTALLLFSSWLLLKATREAKFIWWLAYAVSAAAFAYTHYFAFFSLAAHGAFIVGYLVIPTKGRLGEILEWRQTWHALAAAVIAAVLFVPWLPTLLSQNAQVQESYWIPPIGGWSIPDTFYRMFIPTSRIPLHTGIGWVTLAIVPLAAVIAGWLALALSRRPSRDGRLLIVLAGCVPFIFAIMVSLVGQSLYQDRFFVFAHPFIIIGAAVLMVNLRSATLRRTLAAAAIVGFLAAAMAFWWELNIKEKPGAQAAARTIYTQQAGDELVIVSSPFVFFAIDHYAIETYHRTARPKLYSPDGQLLHFAGAPILTSADLLRPDAFTQPESSSIWVVDTTGFGAAPLNLPAEWQATQRNTYPEVFSYQGEVMVTRYVRGHGEIKAADTN